MDSVLKKNDETVTAVREISSKLDRTNELLERRFQKLEEEIERIIKALMKAGIEV